MSTKLLKEKLFSSFKSLSETAFRSLPFIIHLHSEAICFFPHTHTLYTHQDKHNAESQCDTLFFFLFGLHRQEQFPPTPSLPPASCLLSSPLTRVCWEAASSSFQKQGLRRRASYSVLKHKKEQNGVQKVTAFCTFLTTKMKWCLPSGGRSLCSPCTQCPPHSATELWASSAELQSRTLTKHSS